MTLMYSSSYIVTCVQFVFAVGAARVYSIAFLFEQRFTFRLLAIACIMLKYLLYHN